MRYKIQISIYTLCLVFSAASYGALDRVGDFALLDERGEFHQLSRYRHLQAIAIMSYVEDCSEMDSMLGKFMTLQSRFKGQGIEFLLIDSQGLNRSQLSNLNVELPVLEDGGQLVSESLGIVNAGDVLVLNPERLSLYYKGQPSVELASTLSGLLQDEIDNTISGGEVTTETTTDVTTTGSACGIDYPVKELHASSPPDYATEIAPIIIKNCAECHRQGGVGPFALDSYIMLLGWSPMIKEVLLNRRMPPTQVDPYIGHSDNARYLSTQDMQTIVHWINNRAPRGNGEEDPLESFQLANISEWVFGEPDYIVTGPDNEVPATGVMDYIYEDIDLPFEEDKWLRAIQYKAGDASVLHHLMTFVTAPDEDFWGGEVDKESVTRRFVEGYAPGKANAVEFPEGTGVLIPQGHKLSMQFHYVTNGQSSVDETQLGLYFSDEPDLQEKLTQAVASRFVLPANESNHEMHAQHVFEEDIIITGVRVRMNFRGKKMKFAVELSNGTLKEFFSIPAYNYGWQPHYLLDTPERVPAGSKIHIIGAFDNSISNPSNPDSSKEVTFGLDSWDEMFTGYLTYHKDVD
ncbi:MAG: hypothetical protein COA96_03895 [SAR86 cluster bacterium]|uniref:Cytochrome c domain-containing protein n=1 Tax=SAR86 cluster bacterium TaxID=2030880 RepID=A0A2A5B7U0_9GAMM|nr:MAG: hypothetical protein COA96_03895 [SAR86 cluster bacterium]